MVWYLENVFVCDCFEKDVSWVESFVRNPGKVRVFK